jgi:ABC-type transport system substrate-binding protein
MMMRKRNLGTGIIAVIIVGLLAVPGLNNIAGPAEADEIVLKAAVQDEMKTTNILNSNDVWTSHVLWQCFEGVIQGDPNTLDPVPYILTGLETNGNIGLQPEERKIPPVAPTGFLPGEDNVTLDLKHDAFFQDPANQLTEADKDQNQIIAYYDFTGLKFHDGRQVDIWDILFSYHLIALHPRWYTDISPLMDDGGLTGNYSNDRWLWVWWVDDGDTNDNTAALRFHLTTNYAQLWSGTLSVPIMPRHIWEEEGKLYNPDDGSVKREPLHDDFGRAIDPAKKGYGVNDVRNPGWKKYDLTTGALSWEPKQDEIIGTGMFKFDEYVQGSHAKVVTNENYLTMETGTLSIHVPYIDAIQFIKFSTPQQATMGIKKGEADIILWSVPPDFIKDLQSDPNIALLFNPEPGFFYMAFNMRRTKFGYPSGDPTQGDTGKPLRKAIAHLIDKKTIVDVFLQGYGILARGPVSPLNTFWYNGSLPGYDFDVNTAKSILDANGYVDNDGNTWRDLEPATSGEQDTLVEILAPTADYDPIRAQACILIETRMREAGIQVKCNHQAFGTIINNIDARTFEIYILGWSIGGTDPDYLYSFFYSLNANAGQNYPGYKSTGPGGFDEVILESRTEMNITKRQKLIRDAQGILVEDLPYNVLYYRKNIEAYRVNSFTGWTTSASGTIFNYWSLMNIKPPSEKYLRTTMTVASAVSSFKNETVTVTVRDQDKTVVSGAYVTISVEQGGFNLFTMAQSFNQYFENTSSIDSNLKQEFTSNGVDLSGTAAMSEETITTDNGNITIWQITDGTKIYWFEEEASSQLIYVYGSVWDALATTNANGQVLPKFKAPYTNNVNGTKIGITVKASMDGYDDSGIKSVIVVIFPPGVDFISVTLDLKFGDLINEKESTVMDILVKDQDGNFVDGATVSITSVPSDLEIEPASGETTNGGKMENIELTAPDVTTETKYTIIATPSKAGTRGVEGPVELTVLDIPPPPSTPGFDILTVIAVISMAAVVYGIVRTRQRKD